MAQRFRSRRAATSPRFKTSGVSGEDLIIRPDSDRKPQRVSDFIAAYDGPKDRALRVLAASHKAGRIAFRAP